MSIHNYPVGQNQRTGSIVSPALDSDSLLGTQGRFKGRTVSIVSDSGYGERSFTGSESSGSARLNSRSSKTLMPETPYISSGDSYYSALNKTHRSVLASNDLKEIHDGIIKYLRTIKSECEAAGYHSESKPAPEKSAYRYQQMVDMIAHASELQMMEEIGTKASTSEQIAKYAMDIVQSKLLAESGPYHMRRSFSNTMFKVGHFVRDDKQLIFAVGLNMDCFSVDEQIGFLHIAEEKYKRIEKEIEASPNPSIELQSALKDAEKDFQEKSRAVNIMKEQADIKDYSAIYRDLVATTEARIGEKIESLLAHKSNRDKSQDWVEKSMQKVEKHINRSFSEMNAKLKASSGGKEGMADQYRQAVNRFLTAQQRRIEQSNLTKANSSDLFDETTIGYWCQILTDNVPTKFKGPLMKDGLQSEVVKIISKMEKHNRKFYEKFPYLKEVLKNRLPASIESLIKERVQELSFTKVSQKHIKKALLKEFDHIIREHKFIKKGSMVNLQLSTEKCRFDLKWLSKT